MNIYLKIGGALYSGWTEINVNRTMEALSGVFSLKITNKTRDIAKNTPVLKPGQNCQVYIEKTQILDGYIDKVQIKYNAELHEISVIGRDKAGDLVDCSVINSGAGWRGLKAEKIVEEICKPFGIKVTTQVDTGPPIPYFQVEQGMSAFEAIQKVCSARSCLAISDSKGGLLITRAGAEQSATEIIEGQNIKEAEADYDFSNRYSEYTVKGQKKGTSKNDYIDTTTGKWRVVDEVIKRYRPLLIVADGQADTEKARIRARWEAAVKSGKSRTFTVIVNGWLKKDKKPWEINQLVRLKSPLLGLSDTLVIAGVIYRLDAEGEITEIAMVDKSAYEVLKEDAIKAKTSKDNKYIA